MPVLVTHSSPQPRPARVEARIPRTRGLIAALARWTPYVEDEILGLAAVVARGAVCIDVGANYGLYTHALSWLAGHDGLVHSIEPLPGPFRILTASSALTSAGNVRRHCIALADRPGSAHLSLPLRRGLPVHGRAYLRAGGAQPGANTEFPATRDVPVEVLTLDRLCEREEIAKVDFVKADVEGAEFAVLRGGLKTIATHRPTLLLEIEERHTRRYGHGAKDVVDWLTRRGYRLYCWRDDGWRPVRAVSPDIRNYLFVHVGQPRPAALCTSASELQFEA